MSEILHATQDFVKNHVAEMVINGVPSISSGVNVIQYIEGREFNIEDSSNMPIKNIRLFGHTKGGGSTTLNNPKNLVSAGQSGKFSVYAHGSNLFNPKGKVIQNYGASIASISEDLSNLVIKATTVDAGNVKIQLPDIPAGTQVTIKSKWIASGSNTGRLRFMYWDTVNNKMSTESGMGSITTSGRTITFEMPSKPNATDAFIVALYSTTDATKVAIGDTITYIDLQINIGTKVLPYEPCSSSIFTLNTLNGLSGLYIDQLTKSQLDTIGYTYTYAEKGVLGGTTDVYICDEVDMEKRKYIQRIAEWKYTGKEKITISRASYELLDIISINFKTSDIKSHSVGSSEAISNYGGCKVHSSGDVVLNIKPQMINLTENEAENMTDSEITEVVKSVFSTLFSETNPLIIKYLIDPIEKDLELSDEEILSWNSFKTSKPSTWIYNDFDIYMNLEYVADTKKYIEDKFNELQNAIISLGGNV